MTHTAVFKLQAAGCQPQASKNDDAVHLKRRKINEINWYANSTFLIRWLHTLSRLKRLTLNTNNSGNEQQYPCYVRTLDRHGDGWHQNYREWPRLAPSPFDRPFFEKRTTELHNLSRHLTSRQNQCWVTDIRSSGYVTGLISRQNGCRGNGH